MNRMNVKHKKELALMSIAGICVIVSGILNIMVSLMGTAALKQDKASDRENTFSRKTFQSPGNFGRMPHLQIYISAEIPKRPRSQDRHLYKMKMNIYVLKQLAGFWIKKTWKD